MRQLREKNYPGWSVIDPIEIVYEQACAQWEVFTGTRTPRQVMWEACLYEYAEKMKRHAFDDM